MRYGKHRRQDKDEYPKPTNPIWRGIGCILIIITPLIAFAISNEVMKTGYIQSYIYVPVALRNNFTLPVFNISFQYFNATLALAVAVTVGLFALFFVFYAFIYKIIGPSAYGPMDAPPIRAKRNVRKSR